MRAVLLLAAVLSAPAATVNILDGRTLTGPVLRFEKETLRMGQTSVPIADCDWLEPGSGSGVNLGRASLGVWLADGSWLPASSLMAGKVDHVLRVISPLGRFDVPLTAVRGWSMTADLPSDGPQDRVLLDSGPVTGRIEGLVGGKLLLRSDLSPDKPLEFTLDQVRGLRLTGTMTASLGTVLSVTLDPDRPPLRLRAGEPLALAAVATATLPTLADSPMAAARFRVESGRRVYLSDLTPTEVQDAGAFGVVWPWKQDTNLDGSPLRLGGTRFAKGLVAHSQARLVWRLDGRFTRLRGLVGIADLVNDEGDCNAAILGDEKTLWQQASVKGGEKPQWLDLDLNGVKTLELRVELGKRYDIGDHLVLADAYLIKK